MNNYDLKIPKVIVIIINYNQTHYTIECVKSLLNSDYTNFNILLIDNGSSKNNISELKAQLLKDNKIVIKEIENNVGYVGGVNFGLKSVKELEVEYVLIMNNDTIINNKAITELVECCQRYENKAIVSGKVYHYDEPSKLQYLGTYYTDKNNFIEEMPGKNAIDDGRYDEEMERDMLDDIFWLFHINLIKDIGYYSTDFFLYAEQADFAMRAKKEGYKLIYTPNARLWHKGSITTGSGNRYSPSVNYWRKKSSVIFLYKHQKWYYFIKRTTYLFIKLFVKFIQSSPQDSNSAKAALIGFLHGVKWIFIKQAEKGNNPFIGENND